MMLGGVRLMFNQRMISVSLCAAQVLFLVILTRTFSASRAGSCSFGYGLWPRCVLLGMSVLLRGSEADPPCTQPVIAEVKDRIAPAMDKGIAFLRSAQSADGGWKGHLPGSDPAVTALVARVFIQHPDYGPTHPDVLRAIDFILKHRQPNGGIYNPQVGFANYTTSIAVMALAATKDKRHANAIAEGQNYLKGHQWIENKHDSQGVSINSGHAWYGGAGYGRHKRPDLSNTQMMIEALHESGLPKDDPAYRKALKFIQRCQMFSQTNDQPFARGAEDGGFIYTCANEGESKAGTVVVDGRPMLRSYGSMTYAGFKSMLYANVSRDDVRVRRALDWIRCHWTLESNPNMPGAQSQEGLYYYYHVFAKAMRAWGEPVLVDAQGAKHDWRAELCGQLIRRQRADGHWINEADRWYEGNPYLVTAYALLSLQEATAELRSEN